MGRKFHAMLVFFNLAVVLILKLTQFWFQEEEEERSEKWKSFLDRQAETESSELASAVGEDEKVSGDEVVGEEVDASLEKGVDGHQTSGHVPGSEDSTIENGSQK